MDNKLETLIPDHSLFHERFEMHIYDDTHVIFRVKPVSRKRLCSTMDFYSKVSLNVGVVNPRHSQIQELYRSVLNTEEEETDYDRGDLSLSLSTRDAGQPEVMLDERPFQEKYYLQAKNIQSKGKGEENTQKRVAVNLRTKIANHLGSRLKLCH